MRLYERSSRMWDALRIWDGFFFNNKPYSFKCDDQSCNTGLKTATIHLCWFSPPPTTPVGMQRWQSDCLVSLWNARSPLKYSVSGLGFTGTSQGTPLCDKKKSENPCHGASGLQFLCIWRTNLSGQGWVCIAVPCFLCPFLLALKLLSLPLSREYCGSPAKVVLLGQSNSVASCLL